MEGIIFQILSKLTNNKADQPLVLKPGEIISVYVKQVMGNQAVLRYQGNLFVANLEAKVEAGSKLNCLVQGERDGKAFLKLLPESGMSNQKLNDLVKGLLKNAGLSNSNLNKEVVMAMLRQGMEVSKESVTEILADIKKHGLPTQGLDSVVFLHKQGIPVKESTLSMLFKMPSEEGSLGQELAEFRQLLRSIKAEGQNTSPKGIISKEALTIVNRLSELLEKTTLRQGDNSTDVAAKILLTAESNKVKSSDNQQIPSGQQITNVNEGASEQSHELFGTAKAEVLAKKDFKEVLPSLIRLAEKSQLPNQAEFRIKLQSFLKNNLNWLTEGDHDKISSLLERLQDIIKQEDSPIARELSAKASLIHEKINSYQQINRGLEGGENRDNIFLIQGLANPDNPAGAYEVMIRIKKEDQKRDLNYQDCRLVVSLNTMNLGFIKAQVKVFQRELDCKIFVEKEKYLKAVNAEVETLMKGLNGIGFNVRAISTEIVESQEPALGGILAVKEEIAGFGRVDIRI